MEIKSETTGELTQLLTINVVKADFYPEVEKQIRKYHREARIPGFRPGKAPIGMIRRMYENALMVDEINKLVGKTLQKYIDDNEVRLLGEPLPSEKQEQLDLSKGESFDFMFDIAFQPAIDFNLDKSFEAELLQVNISEKEIDEYLMDLRKRNGKLADVESSAVGDFLGGDLSELESDGLPMPGGIAKENVLIAIDRIQDEEARAKFLGLKVDDIIVFNPLRDIRSEVEISTMLGVEKSVVHGLTSDFSFHVKKVSRLEPATLDEEFFTKVFTSDRITSEDQLRERILRDLQDSYSHESRKLFYYNSLDALVNKADIKLPDEFMKRWLTYQSKEKLSPEAADTQWSIYSPMLRRQILENHILKTHDVKVTMEDMENSVLSLMGMNLDLEFEGNREASKRLASSILQDEKQFDRVRDEVLREKFTELLLNHVNVVQRSVQVDEFINFVNERNNN